MSSAWAILTGMIDQILRFVEGIEHYMRGQTHEQAFKLTNTMPSLEQYYDIRLGSSAVAATLTLNE